MTHCSVLTRSFTRLHHVRPKRDVSSTHQLPWQRRFRYLTHNVRSCTDQVFGEKKRAYLPIAIPISLAFNAGASFTPSPVYSKTKSIRLQKERKKEELTTATTLSPLFFVSSTISNFCSGVVRENTISVYSVRMVFQSSTISCATSSPVKTIALIGSSSVGFI